MHAASGAVHSSSGCMRRRVKLKQCGTVVFFLRAFSTNLYITYFSTDKLVDIFVLIMYIEKLQLGLDTVFHVQCKMYAGMEHAQQLISHYHCSAHLYV